MSMQSRVAETLLPDNQSQEDTQIIPPTVLDDDATIPDTQIPHEPQPPQLPILSFSDAGQWSVASRINTRKRLLGSIPEHTRVENTIAGRVFTIPLHSVEVLTNTYIFEYFLTCN